MKIGSLLLVAATFTTIALAANLPADAATQNIEALEPLGNTALRGFVDRTVTANLEVRAARADMDAGARRAEAAAKPLYNPEIEYESENAEPVVGVCDYIGSSTQRPKVCHKSGYDPFPRVANQMA